MDTLKAVKRSSRKLTSLTHTHTFKYNSYNIFVKKQDFNSKKISSNKIKEWSIFNIKVLSYFFDTKAVMPTLLMKVFIRFFFQDLPNAKICFTDLIKNVIKWKFSSNNS